jgi:type II secretory ATPase GspE/PulE/Tfp pilus assembly ATPase PilB-like protein
MESIDHLSKLQDAIINGNIPQLVMSGISHALSLRSSDIHIEPEENNIRIRYRIDGVLRRIIEYPSNIHMAVVSRIKIMSNLKIDEQRIPQDGRIQITTEDRRALDLRISTLPTINGEKICMRIQDRSKKIPELNELGVSPHSLKYIKKGISSPNGIILTSGPTGSGKTTTLYSCLQALNDLKVNIMTIEDPVEIQMDGLNQSQVHPEIKYTFSFGLRTALRQDPDIIMVGEIRDRETIDVAIEASLTGHLVLSTIHTNSAVDTIVRISNMGVPNYLMTSSLNTIIAQRLIRQICNDCKEKYTPTEKELTEIRNTIAEIHPEEKKGLDQNIFNKITLYKGKGCDKCGHTGYLGRIGVYEILFMTDKLKEMIVKEASSLEIKKTAVTEGMVTLKQAGIIKVLQGESTLDEVYHIAK